MHARGSIEPSSCGVDPQRELQLALDKRNKRGEASVSFLDFDFEDKREASIDHARKRDPFRKDYGERRTVGENDFLEITKGAAAVKLASLQLGRIRRNGGGERVRTERQRANFRFYRAAIRARDISSVVVPFDLVAALRKGEWDLSARGAG